MVQENGTRIVAVLMYSHATGCVRQSKLSAGAGDSCDSQLPLFDRFAGHCKHNRVG